VLFGDCCGCVGDVVVGVCVGDWFVIEYDFDLVWFVG